VTDSWWNIAITATDRNVNIRIGYFSARAPRRCEKLYVKLVKTRIKTAKSAHKTTNDCSLVWRVNNQLSVRKVIFLITEFLSSLNSPLECPNDWTGPSLASKLSVVFKKMNFTLTSSDMCAWWLDCQVPAGLFIPSMAIGAICGRLIGVGMEQLA